MVVKAVKTDFIKKKKKQLQLVKEILAQSWLNSEYNLEKWEFFPGSRLGIGGWKLTEGNYQE